MGLVGAEMPIPEMHSKVDKMLGEFGRGAQPLMYFLLFDYPSLPFSVLYFVFLLSFTSSTTIAREKKYN